MEIQLGEHTYRTGKLDAFKQFHVARRLAPVIFSLGKSIGEVKEITGLNQKQAAEIVQQTEAASAPDDAALGTLVHAFKPMADVISKMSDEDSEYILGACLSVCDRKQPGGWQKVRHANGRLLFEDIDLPTMMQLAITVIKENLGNFFPEPQA